MREHAETLTRYGDRAEKSRLAGCIPSPSQPGSEHRGDSRSFLCIHTAPLAPWRMLVNIHINCAHLRSESGLLPSAAVAAAELDWFLITPPEERFSQCPARQGGRSGTGPCLVSVNAEPEISLYHFRDMRCIQMGGNATCFAASFSRCLRPVLDLGPHCRLPFPLPRARPYRAQPLPAILCRCRRLLFCGSVSWSAWRGRRPVPAEPIAGSGTRSLLAAKPGRGDRASRIRRGTGLSRHRTAEAPLSRSDRF